MPLPYVDSIVYGPLKSRRLGNSLGLNLLPAKTCSLNCVYCEAGSTTNLTIKRESYIPLSTIIRELEQQIKCHSGIEYLTLCGTGEPTLHADIGQLIKFIKKEYPQYKLCLISNSTMFTDDELLQDIALCDLVMPSLDAVSQQVFREIDRPHPDLDISKIITSLIKFSSIYQGEMWLEIFFLEGVNDTEAELSMLKDVCSQIKPDIVQINSLDRKGIYQWVRKVSEKRLLEIQEFLKPCNAKIV
ncbi:MAG: radical SAM protein [Candidatus Cloacimonetes bacterium]|nr:radical SAM protein [Candidatus Cloacimonadota bacterium]